MLNYNTPIESRLYWNEHEHIKSIVIKAKEKRIKR